MRLKLLVDSQEFTESLKQDLVASSHSIYIQTYSFEGDRAGHFLSNLLLNSHVADIKIVIDSFTKWVVNDRFIYTPASLADLELRQEICRTTKLYQQLREKGVQIKFSNPIGFFFKKWVARNHKKLIVVDNSIAYIGGINFSEHNFAWHDVMLRVENKQAATILANDFLNSYNGKNIPARYLGEEIEIYALDGNSNREVFDKILRLIESAKKSIFVESPYLTFPFCDSLRTVREKGVEVNIITPEHNNVRLLSEYIIQEAMHANFRLYLYRPRMNHLKAILIDDKTLILGSSNFECISYNLLQEIVAVITQREIIDEFIQRVIKKDIGESNVINEHRMNYVRRLFIFIVRRFARLANWSGRDNR